MSRSAAVVRGDSAGPRRSPVTRGVRMRPPQRGAPSDSRHRWPTGRGTD